MDKSEIIGSVATLIGSFSYFPQAIKAYRIGSAREISSIYLVCHFTSNMLWLSFGILISSPSLLTTTSLSTILDIIWFINMYKDYKNRKFINLDNSSNNVNIEIKEIKEEKSDTNQNVTI